MKTGNCEEITLCHVNFSLRPQEREIALKVTFTLLVARRATYVVDGRFFGHFLWKVGGSSAHTREARAAHVWQLMCMVITIWWRGALTCGN